MGQEIALNIVLVGIMGSGKSALASSLVKQTGGIKLDSDHAIESRFGLSVSKIFATLGEQFFRDAETRIIREMQNRTGYIFSTGGGIITREINRSLLPSLGLVVWLHASEDVLFERVSRNNRRPLLQTADPRATLHALYEQRLPWYREIAHLQVDTGVHRRTEVVRIVLEAAGWNRSPR